VVKTVLEAADVADVADVAAGESTNMSTVEISDMAAVEAPAVDGSHVTAMEAAGRTTGQGRTSTPARTGANCWSGSPGTPTAGCS
jgi:hypothetical protein